MRNKLIFILFFLTSLLQIRGEEDQLLHYVTDFVSADSYSYYNLEYEGLIKIKLISNTGDSDLYISQYNKLPTYEPESYCLHSSTCGEDEVIVPENFKRPISIGIYGHPFHTSSSYTLLVYKLDPEDEDNYYFDKADTDNEVKQEKPFKSSRMLEYENQMFLEILQEDGLIITAKGLSLECVFTNILKAYCDPGQLVLVLGTNDYDELFFIDQLKKEGVKCLPRIITAQCLSEERDITYLEGGVLFISGRILVVDLLKKRVPVHLVSGILVYRAHSILNSHQEAFALRLYRLENKTGFIKAFTNSALAFTIGFTKVEQVMKRLYVKKLYLWPRFHKIVNNCLSKYKPEVFELHVKLTTKMLSIQTGLLDVMNYMVQELKRINKYLDLDELNVENAIAKKFHKQLQLQLDPIWDQLSFKTKQIISDLKTQRSLIMCLTHEDCVSFLVMLKGLRTMEYAMKSSGWADLDIVDEIFQNARDRVYNDKGELSPEANPKWIALSEILKEINNDNLENESVNIKKILVLTQDNHTCKQLNNYLTLGAKEYLLYETMKKLKPDKIKAAQKPEMQKSAKKGKPGKTNSKDQNNDIDEKDKEEKEEKSEIDEEDGPECYFLTLSQVPESKSKDDNKEPDVPNCTNYFEDCSALANLDLTTLTKTEPLLMIQALKKGGDPMALLRTLDDIQPSYVIMYTADISAIRQLEIYQNKNPNIALKVYFLIYGDSVEEQAYLTSLRREKQAFDKLIAAKTTMVVPEEQDGKTTDKSDNTNENASEENTRKGGLQEAPVSNKIIVDMREFRSELPSLLHQRDIDIEPITLLIGDYILSPDICVERKSISDLIGSLNSGRLYNQAISMTRYYAKPMLLIEFDQNKPFALQGNYYVSRDMKSIEITNKLQLLTLHFPRLKIVWSPSPHATAQLFEELKQGRAQPDGEKAAQVGIDTVCDDQTIMAEKYNPNIQDLVAKLPGVNTKNLRIILNKGKSLDNLCKLTKEEINAIIGNKTDAEALYRALHDKNKISVEATGTKNASKVKSRGLFFKNKRNP